MLHVEQTLAGPMLRHRNCLGALVIGRSRDSSHLSQVLPHILPPFVLPPLPCDAFGQRLDHIFTKSSRRCTPPLVGASTTVIGNQMYLFGGRLVTERRMVADLYCFHLEEYTWERLPPPELDPNAPPPRYFHSADAWNGHLVIFGGMGYATSENVPEELCVLADVRLYSLADASWLAEPPSRSSPIPRPADSDPDPAAAGETPVSIPRARYAHLSAVSGNQLYIIGGQDMSNAWLDDIHVFDIPSRTWVSRIPYPRHCGTYRSVAVCAPERVVNPPRISANIHDEMPGNQDELIELPFTADCNAQYPNSIYLYSNHNFTDVKRELQTLHPTPSTRDSPFTLTDASALLTGTSLPPGLRFPTGALLGTHLLIAGTYLAHTFQSYSLWALDLRTYTWSRIDPGAALSHGSWGRGVVWGNNGRFVVFGNREGNLVEDYNRRLLSWGDVAYVDLEAFGIYSPPRRMFSTPTPPILTAEALANASVQDPAQTHALLPVIANLRTLHQEQLADFEIVADDNRRIKCSSAVLEARWGWFRRQRQLFRKRAQKIEAELSRDPARGRSGSRGGNGENGDEYPDINMADGEFTELDPRLSSRELRLSEPYAVTLALLQYLYGLTLVTSLQHAPPVLSALLLIACTYTHDDRSKDESDATEIRPNLNLNGNGHAHSRSPGSSPSSGPGGISLPSRPTLPQFDAMPHLMALVKHAMHRALSSTNSVGVYEVATLCDCQSLQIRALKVVMASSKKQAHKQRQHGSSSGPSGRPRGISDITGPPPHGRPRTAEGAGGAPAGGNSTPATPTGRQKRLHTADGTRPREPLVRNTPSESPPLSAPASKVSTLQGTNGVGPIFGPVPKHSPPAEPLRTSDPFDRAGRQGYRALVDAVGDGLYSDDGGHPSESQHSPTIATSRSDAPPVSRSNELLLNSRNSHAALRGLYSRHRPALDEHGNPMDIDLEQRKAQIVRRWSQHVTTIDNEDPHRQEDQRQPLPDVSSGPRPLQSRNDASVSPSRLHHSPTTSPVFTGGASLATVSSVSTSSSARPGSASSGGSGSVRAPTDHMHPASARFGGHQHQGSETTVRPAAQEKGRRVMVGTSPYGVPIYREVRQDEPGLESRLVGTNPVGKNRDKDKALSSGKNEGSSGGLGWLLSPQAKAEKAAAKVQAKIEKRAREAAEREAASIRDAERRRLKEEVQDRLAKVRAGSAKDPQAKELARIDTFQFAFMSSM